MDRTQLDTLMTRLGTTPLTRAKVLRGLAASAAALAGLPTVRASPTDAQGREEEGLQRAFDELRADIVLYVPEQLQPAFLAEADAALIALLLPAVQAAREAARSDECAAVRILRALRRQNRVAADTFKHDYVFGVDIVEDDIDAVLQRIAPSPRC